MKLISPLIAATCLFPTFALADQVQRLSAANDIIQEKMEVFYVSRVPELAGKMPDMTLDTEMETALRCTLDMFDAEGGAGTAERYVTSLEQVAQDFELTGLDQIDSVMGDIDEALGLKALQSCGMFDISMRRMQASGMMEALSNPDVIQRLMSDG